MPKPDSNTQVFRTISQTGAARQAQQLQTWKDTAIAILQEIRPNRHATAAPNDFALILQDKDLRQVIDLSPLVGSLTAQSYRSDSILRDYLTQHLPSLDQEWLSAQPVDQIRPNIRAWPIGIQELDELNHNMAEHGPVHSTPVAGELYWIPVARLPGLNTPIPIGPKPLKAWQMDVDQLDRLALANLQSDLKGSLFETIRFGPAGSAGRLKPTVDPGVVLLPEFLRQVQDTWHSQDDLALLLTSQNMIEFIESRNKSLLDLLYPKWHDLLETTAQPLSRKPLLLTNQGIIPMDYAPPVQIRHLATTRPATQPAKPKLPAPRPYVVH
ncbi:MAG: hypothetical protein ACM359_20050 [Bacillota bacterium]